MKVKFKIKGKEFIGNVICTGCYQFDKEGEHYEVEIEGLRHATKIIPASECEAIN